jgi:hypothetical protein
MEERCILHQILIAVHCSETDEASLYQNLLTLYIRPLLVKSSTGLAN